MATHSSILACRIPWMEKSGGLQSMGSQSDMTESIYHACTTTHTHTLEYYLTLKKKSKEILSFATSWMVLEGIMLNKISQRMTKLNKPNSMVSLICGLFLSQIHWNKEKAMAPHSSTLVGKSHGQRSLEGCSPWGRWGSDTTEATSLSVFTFMHWRRKWQPTPVFLPGESQGRGSLVGCCPWGHTESDTTEAT